MAEWLRAVSAGTEEIRLDPEDRDIGDLGKAVPAMVVRRGGGRVGDCGELEINGGWKVVDIKSHKVW